jgi:hypothetical protein
VVHDVADVAADALVVRVQEREHIITLTAAKQLGQDKDSIGGDDVRPFVGRDVPAPEVTDTATLVVTRDPQCAVFLEGGIFMAGAAVVAVLRRTTRRTAQPGLG